MNAPIQNVPMSELLALSVPEKLVVIGALWESIEPQNAQIPCADNFIAELDRRKAAAEANPESLVPWDSIRQRLRLDDVG